MTLRIFFYRRTWLAHGLLQTSVKKSTSINMSPTPIMYAWSICARLHGSASLDHEFKVVSVKSFLHFLHLFIFSLTSREYPGHYTSNFILFCEAAIPQWISTCTHFITNFLCFWGNYQIPITNHSMFYFFLISLLGPSTLEQFSPDVFFFLILDVILLSTESCLVSTAIQSKDNLYPM